MSKSPEQHSAAGAPHIPETNQWAMLPDAESAVPEVGAERQEQQLKLFEGVGSTALESVVEAPEDVHQPELPFRTDGEVYEQLKLPYAAEVGTAALGSTVEVKPVISARRVLDTRTSAQSETDNELVQKLTSGKISQFGTRLSGAKQLRSDRKHVIEKQRGATNKKVERARDAKYNAVSKRLNTYVENNAIARVGMRSQKRAELKDVAFKAIAEDASTGALRKRLLRIQARKNARVIAKEQVKHQTTEALTSARRNHLAAKAELTYQKDRRRQVRLSPMRRRTTLGNGASASFIESWKDAGTDLKKTETQKAAERKRKLEALHLKAAQYHERKT